MPKVFTIMVIRRVPDVIRRHASVPMHYEHL